MNKSNPDLPNLIPKTWSPVVLDPHHVKLGTHRRPARCRVGNDMVLLDSTSLMSRPTACQRLNGAVG
ncbi:hypothetical protein FCV25MIE_01134, partial [Fagus crenata]